MRRISILLSLAIILLALAPVAVQAQQVHVVQAGENLFKIGQRYSISYLLIAQANNIPEPYQIHAGNQLVIPGPDGSTGAAPAARSFRSLRR